MKQYRPLLFIVITLLIGWTLLIQEACGQQLKQIQKGTANNQIPVTNGYQYTQVYRNAIPYILDTLGIRDSICCTDSIFLRDSVIVLRDGSGFVYKSRIYDYNVTSVYYSDIANPQKGDIWIEDQYDTSGKSRYYDGSTWQIFSYDSQLGNEGVLSLVNEPDLWNHVDIRSNGFGMGSAVGVKGDTLIRVSYDEIVPILRLKLDTLQLNTRINNFISDSLATIISAPDSTFIKKLWGITLDSVGNTYSIGADSAQVTSIYQNSLKENILTFNSPLSRSTNTISIPAATTSISGHLTSTDWNTFDGKVGGSGSATRVAFWNGTNSLSSNANLYWDNTNSRLGIGTVSPSRQLTTTQDISANGNDIGLGGGNQPNNARFGNAALNNNTTGVGNLAIGAYALLNNTTGYYNVALGNQAMFYNVSGHTNTAIGQNTLIYNTGSKNTGIGTQSLYNNIGGLENTGIGPFSLYSNVTGNSNIAIGYGGGYYETGSGKLYIEPSTSSTPLIGGDFVTDRVGINTPIGSIDQTLDITGTMRLTGSDGTATVLMGRDADGDVSAVGLSGLSMVSGTLTNSFNGDITGVTVSAPITGGGTSGSVNIALDTTSTTGAFTQYDGSLKQNKLTGATGQTLYFSATNTPTATYQVFINGSGQVGINNPSPAYHLDVSGNIKFNGLYDTNNVHGDAGQVLTSLGYDAVDWVTPPTASSSVTGYLSSTDWTTFNNKVGGSGTTNKLAYWNGTNTIAANNNFHLDNTNSTLSIGVGSAGTYPLDIQSNGASQALRAMNSATTKGFTVTPTTTANAQSVGVYGNILIDGQIHSSTQTPAYGTSGQVLTSQGTSDWIWTTPSSGTVSSFSSGNLSPLFTTSVSNSTTTPALSFSLSSVANANYIYASPNGSSGTPSFRAMVAADVPTLNQNTTGTAGSAGALITARTIGIVTGDATSAGSSFNGTANNTNALTLATVNANVGTFTNATVTVNAKGLITAASSGASSATNLSFSGASSPYTLNSSTGTDVTFTAGSNITLSGSASNLTINNPAPDQVVSITGAGTNVVTGAYPSFTITDKSTTTQTFTSSGTYTKPAGAKSVYVRVIGAGGGGGGGSRFATSTFTPGGGGGNGGGISEYTFHADDVPSSVSVIVGTGGGGGAGATSNDTEGTTGTTGGVSNFGTLLYAEGGLGGKSFDAQKASLGVIEDGGVGAYYSGAGAAFTAANTKVSPTGGGAGGYISAANATNNTNVTAGTLILTSNSGTPNTGIRSGIGGVGGNASTSGNGSAGTAAAATGYGAGGGGGGAARNSVGNGGAGASGRQGAVIVITYF